MLSVRAGVCIIVIQKYIYIVFKKIWISVRDVCVHQIITFKLVSLSVRVTFKIYIHLYMGLHSFRVRLS